MHCESQNKARENMQIGLEQSKTALAQEIYVKILNAALV